MIKEINKSNFYKNRKLFKIDDIDVDKILLSKKGDHIVQLSQLNSSLDITTLMPLDLYV